MTNDNKHMPDLFVVLLDVIEKLDGLAIPYMLTGSVAGYVWGVKRFTNDIDIVVALYNMDSEQIMAAFANDYYVAETALINTLAGKEKMFNIISEEYALKVDLICLDKSEYRQQQFERKRSIEFTGKNIWVISPEDLILSKLVWIHMMPSDMQKNDILSLMKFPGIELEYINSWASKLGVMSIWQDIQTQQMKRTTI